MESAPAEKGPIMTAIQRLEEYLGKHSVAYEIHHHSTAAFTAQEVAEFEHVPGKEVAKVVIVIAGERPTMLVLPAPARVNLDLVGEVLGVERVTLAEEHVLGDLFPDCELGAMPPFGNLYGIPVYADRVLTEDETIYFQAGTHHDMVEMRFADWQRLVEPVVAHLAGTVAAR